MPAPRKQLPPGQGQKIKEAYGQPRPGGGTVCLKDLADQYGHCVSVIRKVLVEAGIPIPTRGRPRKY
jgi:hypothetical protein